MTKLLLTNWVAPMCIDWQLVTFDIDY